MAHRAHLTTVRVASGLRDALRTSGYGRRFLRADLLAGLTVAVVAVPLAMALAIASGVPPQYGLYSAAVAGFIAALTGGSRYSVTGPTAAFVVVLAPITARYGMGGLATAGLMAGVILLVMGVARFGRLIEYVPEPVTVGFTAGIALSIALLQLNDALGLGIDRMPEQFVGKLEVVATAFPGATWAAAAVAVVTLAVSVMWPQERLVVPGYAPALVVGSLLALVLARTGQPVDTIATRFGYEIGGIVGHGVPSVLPRLVVPWHLPGPDGSPFVLTWSTARALLPSALSIAVLGAIESLLCAVVLDRATGTRHHSNGELVGQGLANLAVPFVGGVPSTAAIARSIANINAGARSPFAAAFHAVFVVIAVLVLAPALGHIPMAAMAAVLLHVAWRMSDAPAALRLVRRASNADRLVLAVCFLLTVAFDMVIAITVGMVLASFLLMRDMARFTQVRALPVEERPTTGEWPDDWRGLKITGAMFFAAAERVLSQILFETPDDGRVIVHADGVTFLDEGGIGALERFAEACRERGIHVLLAGLQPQPARAVAAAGIGVSGALEIVPTLGEAAVRARSLGATEPYRAS